MMEKKTDNLGNYKFILPVGRKYIFRVKNAKKQEDITANLVGLISKKTMPVDSISFSIKPEESTSLVIEHVSDTIVNIPKNETDTNAIDLEKGSSLILEKIIFKNGNSDLLSSSITELNKLLDYLNKNPTIKIEISGHTDNTGTLENNKTLSQERADAVKIYLISKNIDKNRLKTIGRADEISVKSNSTKEGKQENRRVEIKILE